ncbi:MAG: DNA-binding transcriptional activator DecR [Candidatus Erwinia impunctatus]|nr:DNA-binding transcriptional activator DecR [Culicoides impunctatus]
MLIDEYDQVILTLLKENGRLTNQELGESVGLSASQCSRRRIQLEEAGIIMGYHAQILPAASGLAIIGLIEVRLLNHTESTVTHFHQMITLTTEITDVYKTTGDADYLLKVAVTDLAALSALISRLVSASQSVAHVKTSVVLERVKENGLILPGACEAG